MITFYPRDIGMWRNVFTFNDITLSMANKSSAGFKDRTELIEFLKEHGVKLTDPKHPLKFERIDTDRFGGGEVYQVLQWSLVGWVKEDYR